jgi:hypothetical protein
MAHAPRRPDAHDLCTLRQMLDDDGPLGTTAVARAFLVALLVGALLVGALAAYVLER